MADSAPGYTRRPDEPQCYNCGTTGHWAVACPEPTRQTPAGLEAWRNTSTSTQSHGKDHRGTQKKSKGPIITRYAPPPGQTASHAPHPGYYSGPGQYPGVAPYPQHSQPPQPPHYSQPPPPPPPQYPSYPPPAPQYPPGYHHPPSYPPQLPNPPDYSRPSPAGLPPRPEYGGHPLPPPPHSSAPPYRPTYASYTPPLPPGAPPGPPPVRTGPAPRPPGGVPPVPNVPGYGSNRSNHSRSQPSRPQNTQRKNHPPPQHASKSQGPASEPSQRAPVGQMAPSERIAHGLPPKPPVPTRDRPDTRRDHRNKKKQDQQKGNRDSRHKDQSGNKRSSNHRQNRNNRRRSSQGQNLPNSSPSQKNQLQKDAGQDECDRQQSPTKSEHTQESGEVGPAGGQMHSPELHPDKTSAQADGDDASDFEWAANVVFQESEGGHGPDEVGQPLPSTYTEDVILPRKWNSKCIESKFINTDNLEEFTQPIHETQYWKHIEFDPAFIRDGKCPSGDPLPKAPRADELPEEETLVQEDIEETGDAGVKSPFRDGLASDGHPKRKRSLDTHIDNLQEPTHQPSPPGGRQRPRERGSESYRPEPSRHERGRQGGSTRREVESQRRSSPGSRRSSVSSASSHSSGLDSLDRELLGIEPKDTHQQDEDRGRQGLERAPKPKRRRVQLDSAYSRRW